MIRIILMTVAFFAATGALLWGLNGYSDGPTSQPDQVSRTAPDPLGLQPSLTAAIAPVQTVAEPQPQVVQREPISAPARQVAVAQPAATQDDTDASSDLFRTMSLGIVKELQKPVVETAPRQTARVEAPVERPAAVRTHVVQPGDSLPGIAFRYYGTTVAYIQILNANEDVLSAPSDLAAGMVLRVPELK